MSATREEVNAAIDSEREFQDRRWGTVEEHPHEIGAWLTIMRKYLNDADAAWASGDVTDSDVLAKIRKLLAVGVACCEEHGISARR